MQASWNRPGLNAISYRAGTYSSFFAAMKDRLASAGYPGLSGLRTRDTADWTIALLDAWASVADVLTFYQERIANEGYVRTATQRLSVLEIGRTVGYTLRPGVAAQAYLAYTMDPTADVTIPAGTLAQSTPGQNQLPQAFETSASLHAKGDWNTLGLRMTQPQSFDLAKGPPGRIYLQGTNLNLNPDDVLLFVERASTESAAERVLARIATAEVQQPQKRTLVRLTAFTSKEPPSASRTERRAEGAPAAPRAPEIEIKPIEEVSPSLLHSYRSLSDDLLKAPAAHPASALQLKQSVSQAFGSDETIAKTLAVMHPELASTFISALEHATAVPPAPIDVYVFRVKALPFGANAPLHLLGYKGRAEQEHESVGNVPEYAEWLLAGDESPDWLWLDHSYPLITPDSWVVVTGPGESTPIIAKVRSVGQSGRAQYGISGSPMFLEIATPWYSAANTEEKIEIERRRRREATIGFLRKTNVFAQSEQLPLAEVAISEPLEGGTIPLDGVYDGLEPGRWLIVTGTRKVLGVPGSELMMLESSTHTVNQNLPGDTLHTELTLSTELSYKYERSSVQIFGNVIPSTNGQTWNETLGSGNGSLASQQFTLKQKPLTFVPVQNAAGVASTLQVSVNGVVWKEAARFEDMKPADRCYVTQTDNAMNTTVIFGDGVHGSRLPTGVENVTAVYRAGIGTPGNVDANQVTLLASRPLGVRAVTNPQPGSGGVDPESAAQGRANVPLATAALDRIVSLGDYAAVARTYASVAKALAAEFCGAPPLVHVTIAEEGDASVDIVSSLGAMLLPEGGAQIALDIQLRSLVIVVLSAQVTLTPGTQWSSVEPAIRSKLLAKLGFNARNLAQDMYLSEVIAAIAEVAGVEYVRITAFDGVTEDDVATDLTRIAKSPTPAVGERIAALPPRRGPDGAVLPAQLAIFKPALSEAIILQQATS